MYRCAAVTAALRPTDPAERVDELAGDFTVRFLARTFLPARLGGLSPAALSDQERDELRELFREQVNQALEILERVGVRAGCEAVGLAQSVLTGSGAASVWMVWWASYPRALAKRLPTSPDTHRHARNDGQDIYGQLSCSETLRAGHVGVLAAAGGLWHSRNPGARAYAETTAGELAQLITGRRRLGGKDVHESHRLLGELEQLELSATVNAPKDGGKPNLALAIPRSPVDRVERRLPDGRCVEQASYVQALSELSDEHALWTADADASASEAAGVGTMRIYLAEWFREQIAYGELVRVDFRVWAHLRPLGQRLYAWLQGTHRDSYDDAIEFYLAAPLRYTVGLKGRQHRAAASANQLYEADRRYHRAPKWSIRGRYANTNIPAFRIGPHRRASAPTERALKRTKCPAERPAALRGLTVREAREQLELVRQALQQATAPAQTVEHDRRRDPRRLARAVLAATAMCETSAISRSSSCGACWQRNALRDPERFA